MTYKQYTTKKAREIFNSLKNDLEALEFCREEHWIGWDTDPCYVIQKDIENGLIHVPNVKNEEDAYDIVIDEITEKLGKHIEKFFSKIA